MSKIWGYYHEGGYEGNGVKHKGRIKSWGSTVPKRKCSACPRFPPGEVFGLGSGVSAIAAGDNQGCAMTAAGAVKCWGYAISGFRPHPEDIRGLESGVTAVASGGSAFPWALTTSGGVKCVGVYNGTIQLSDIVGYGASQISTGFAHACVLMSTGALNCWGNNNSGQLGDGTLSDRDA